MDSLAGQKLVKADGSSAAADAAMADKELILYYFSAHWCPPCRQFTPLLKDFYDVSFILLNLYLSFQIKQDTFIETCDIYTTKQKIFI